LFLQISDFKKKIDLLYYLELQSIALSYYEVNRDVSLLKASKPLEPSQEYANISCSLTKTIMGAKPTICYHQNGDNVISGLIRQGKGKNRSSVRVITLIV
jgi:hypothetical protein